LPQNELLAVFRPWQNVKRGFPLWPNNTVGEKMHRRAKSLVGSLVGLALAVYCYFQAPILPFRTVVSGGGPDHILTESALKKEEKQAVAAVLDGYGVRHFQTKSSILITPRLFFDRELRWNYTSKAR
jgi:hypothetical protein